MVEKKNVRELPEGLLLNHRCETIALVQRSNDSYITFSDLNTKLDPGHFTCTNCLYNSKHIKYKSDTI